MEGVENLYLLSPIPCSLFPVRCRVFTVCNMQSKATFSMESGQLL